MKAQLQYMQQELGLSHRQLALLLGTTRSTVTRCLTGLRSLPPAAEARLALLYAKAVQTEGSAPGDTLGLMAPAVETVDTGAINQALQEAKGLQKRLEQRQAALTKGADQARRLDQWLAAIAPHRPHLSAPRVERCLGELQQQVQKKLHNCHADKARLERMLEYTARDIVWLEHCLREQAIPDFPENQPNSS